MHHKLGIHPIPEKALYINELSMAAEHEYETTKEVEQALTGKTVSNGSPRNCAFIHSSACS